MNTKQKTHCNKCGCECYWDTNRHGKRYLAQDNQKVYSGAFATWVSPHYCTATEEDAAEYQANLQQRKDDAVNQHIADIANGKIVKGQTVVVVKGRKFAKGLTGLVFWVAPEPDQYRVTKVGMTTEAGEKIYINIENVLSATSTTKETAQ